MALSIIECELLTSVSDPVKIWPAFETHEGEVRVSLGGILNPQSPTTWIHLPIQALKDGAWSNDTITISTQDPFMLLTCFIPERVLIRFGLREIHAFLEDAKNDRG